jgi:uncharacterized membrane protein (DUF2068 family)
LRPKVYLGNWVGKILRIVSRIRNEVTAGTSSRASARETRVVRGVALLEAAKGLVVIFAGFGLLSLVHRNLQSLAEQFVGRLHLNPAKETARIFLEAASHLDDARLRLLALLALLYASLRLIEAYGLWMQKRWAEWFAVVSGGIYVPLEISELTRGFAWVKVSALAINLVIVIYIGFVLAKRSPLK